MFQMCVTFHQEGCQCRMWHTPVAAAACVHAPPALPPAAAAAVAAPAELIQQLVQFGWLAWGGKHAAKRRATAHISDSYFAEPALEQMVSK
jgi:hypothetical protein